MSILSSPNPHILYRDILYRETHLRIPGPCQFQPKQNGLGPDWIKNNNERKRGAKRDIKAHGLWPEASKPSTLEMEPIRDCEHFDQILDIANQLSQPIVVDWMAAWCRKCIFMKPKLEKIAAEYDTKLKFYCVDVNKVPQALVKRGNISKMPTIQIWKDGEMKAEVIGGHKAWLVVEEVRAMIQQFV